MLDQYFISARQASHLLATVPGSTINQLLLNIADSILQNQVTLLDANRADLDKMPTESPLYDRLMLTPERLQAIASDMQHVATLPSPLGRILTERTLPNGLQLSRVSVPFGVIGIIYEARPNVTFDTFALCIKAGSACVLKGGKDAENTNRAAIGIIHDELVRIGLPAECATLLPSTHESATAMLHARGLVDLVIPRGSRRLIDFVRNEATVPVIETGAGVCHTYVDADADPLMAQTIVLNAKTRRVSVCNALDCMLIHTAQLSNIALICSPLADAGVVIHADTESMQALSSKYPSHLLCEANADDYGTEYLSLQMAIKTVGSVDEAIRHIRQYGSGHSECIVTNSTTTADTFLQMVDAACVYHNAPTSFTDGAQFGLGAEIGISTQKLHARGPMALEEITTYKWIIRGNGQTRP